MTGEQCQAILESMGFVVMKRIDLSTMIAVDMRHPASDWRRFGWGIRWCRVRISIDGGGHFTDEWCDGKNQEILRELGIQVTDELIAAADALRHCS